MPFAVLIAAPLILARPQVSLAEVFANPVLKGASISVLATDENGNEIFALDPDRRVVPASNMKLISNLFALEKLGTDYRPVTKFWKEGDSVFIEAPGDPTMTSEQLRHAAEWLGGKVKTVYLRQAYKPGVHPTWEVDDLPNRYAAPVTALTVDRGSFEVWADPTGMRPLPEEFGLATRFSASGGDLAAKYSYWSEALSLSGKLPEKPTMVEAFALRHPDTAAAKFFGWRVLPSFRTFSREPDQAIVGPTLIEIEHDCLVRSDNLYAENLLLMGGLAGTVGDKADPYGIATTAATDFLLNTVKWPGPAPRVVDGSGLSRQDLVTARGLNALLRWAQTRPYFDQFYAALVTPGSGTLDGRLAGSTFHGKTGTLTGAVSLSGYLTTPSGKRIVVSMILNNYAGTTSQARAVVDQAVRILESGQNQQ